MRVEGRLLLAATPPALPCTANVPHPCPNHGAPITPPKPRQVARKFPRKDAPILVACTNGRDYSIDVLEALEEEG